MSSFLWFVVWAATIFVMMRFGCGAHVMGHSQHGKHAKGGGGLRWEPPIADTDPVCGKTVKTADSKPSVFDGHVYYFCSRDCREIFEAAPQRYAKGHGDAAFEHMGDTHA